MKTPKNPPKKGGKSSFRGKEDGIPFSKENQPTPQQKREGWAKRKRGAELVKHILEQKFVGAKDGLLKKEIAQYFGCPESEITNEMAMTFRQVQKSLSKVDTQAYNSVMNRGYGMPKQQTDITSDGKEINQIPTAIANATIEQLTEIIKAADTKGGKD